jgi:dimeric dUTPase (all-alpha-NTP-PPase superfamily)
LSNWNWLASTRALQEEAFGRNFENQDPDELADAIVMNHSALIVELSEFMQEVGWKDWATPRGWVNRDAAVGELVDAAHFLANLLVRLGVTDAEWEERYRGKQEINRQRQRSGYTGRHEKCPSCGRAFDDIGVTCSPSECNDA